MARKHSETPTKKPKGSPTKPKGSPINEEDSVAPRVALAEGDPASTTGSETPATHRQKVVAGDKSDVLLKLEEFKIYVDLYKYFLRISLSVIIFFLTVVGGIMTIIFRPANDAPGKQVVDTLIRPAKLMFFTTPFIISCVLALTFAVGAGYWGYSTNLVNERLKGGHVEVELV
ncbi:MAG TPA: hypothetical protein VGB05_10760, partial [Pyrinomonadaceae bacterium]